MSGKNATNVTPARQAAEAPEAEPGTRARPLGLVGDFLGTLFKLAFILLFMIVGLAAFLVAVAAAVVASPFVVVAGGMAYLAYAVTMAIQELAR